MPLASIIFLAFIGVAHAQVNIPGSPAATPAANPGAVVAQVYQFALLIGGLLAFGAIVYGGIKYTVSAGNPSGESSAKEWITGALWGLLLLLGSYLILNTINPNLTNLNLPTLEKLQPPPAGSTPISGALPPGMTSTLLSESRARQELSARGIKVLNECPINVTKNCVLLEGVRGATINEMIALKNGCSTCNITITGGTELAHTPGLESHSTGYKVDLGRNPSIDGYIKNNVNFALQPTLRSDGAPLWLNLRTGALYAAETNHWDVLVK